ncbi:MAG: hypothetical protein ABJA37_07990, partial [Ferruginibacter sp.]
MNARISILSFPQRWKNNQLTLRVLVIPRNFNPLIADQVAPGTVPWVDAVIKLRARLITDGEKYPSILEIAEDFPLTDISMPANIRPIFEDIDAQYGGIPATGISNTLKPPTAGERARKYLPESYRNSFNFTRVRTPDAAIDDSYHCAIKDKTPSVAGFESKYDLSWGKVFAQCLRQPALAERVGFVYEATFDVNPDFVKEGSWIYVDLDDGCSYKEVMDAAPPAGQKLVKRYAAKLPKLKKDDDRALFAAVQFPVLIKDSEAGDNLDEDIPLQPSGFDELLIETEQYDDGFCKIVHANQPVSSDLLREKEDKELPVITDAGIRLGWDDEQLLIWMNRQIKLDDALPTKQRMDAPMGVLQYRVDVRLNSDVEPNPNPWMPLCKVRNKADLVIGGELIDDAGKEKELGVEVYPAKPDATPGTLFWLPQYYSHWTGKSLVLTDNDAIEIFKKQDNVIAEKKARKYDQYEAAGLDDVELLYGTKYDFRVRLADISGGGPTLDEHRKYGAPSPEGFCDFRRTVQPQAVRLENILPLNDAEYFTDDTLVMKRPLLGYPSVLFTGRYPNAVADLIADSSSILAEMQIDLTKARPIGLADPDVEWVEVLVEVKALEMDMQLRHNPDSHESYAKLYITQRPFPKDDFNGDCNIPVTYVDSPVLVFTDSQDLGTLGLVAGGDNIDEHADIILPTSRDIRITLRPIVVDKPEYYAQNSDLPRKGKPLSFITRKAGKNEKKLFKELPEVDTIRGIWLQPDTDTYLKATLTEIFVENNSPVHTSSMIERLADAIDKTIEVESKGLSLVGKQGTRIQFGACRAIRHNMAPDSTSITFSTKSDLLNHWVVPITLILNRDWTWDGAKPVSFEFYRQKKFVGAGLTEEERNAIAWEDEEVVGDIEMKQAINIQALSNADRSQTYLCFLDAVEPKPKDAAGFPEELMVKYRILPNFKSLPAAVNVETDDMPVLQLHLPITGKPAQVPKIVSAGIAQSKYVSDDVYSSTEPRRRFLWLEFEEPLQNKNDAYFIRMLAYSPDPLLSRWEFEMLKAPEEPTLPINPEPIRLISPQHTDDKSGLNAMQELTAADKKADKDPVHYLVPLPPGMHASSAELFGFLTYELRVGHKKGWSTAQARFGSPLRTTGVQHPLPQLFCIINRNEKHIMVTAPFAQTVFNGADVTSNPPRTQLWALLYAQVKRADDKAYRNILLDDQLFVRQRKAFDVAGKPIIDINTDAIQYGITGWNNKDVQIMLQQYGLPIDSSLSVLVVELLPTYDKFFGRPAAGDNNPMLYNRVANFDMFNLQQGMAVSHFKSVVGEVNYAATDRQQKLERERQLRMDDAFISQAEKEESIRPLTEQLGSERIL